MCFFTCSPRPPTLSQCHMNLHVWAYPRPGYIFQVSSKSVQGFQSPRGSKFGLSHYFGYSLLQQLVLPYKPSFVRSFIHSYIHLAFHASNGKQLKWVNCEVHRKSLTNNCIPRMTPRKLPPQTLQITYGCQSTRHMTNSHMVNSSKSQLVTVNSSHDQLVTRSSRHIVQLKSHG